MDSPQTGVHTPGTADKGHLERLLCPIGRFSGRSPGVMGAGVALTENAYQLARFLL